MESIFETMGKIFEPVYKPMQLAAIGTKINGKITRIAEGQGVRVEDGKITSLDNPTHIVTATWGKVNDTGFEFHLIDIKTKELSILKLN